MNILGRIDKAPAEVTPYTVLYAQDMDAGDTLTAVEASVALKPVGVPDSWRPAPCAPRAPFTPPVSSNPMAVGYATYTNDPNLGPFAKVQLAGGALGDTWIVTVTATTNTGRVMVDTFIVRVK